MKKLKTTTLFTLPLLVLAACGGGSDTEGSELNSDEITVGVTAGPHEEVMEKVQEVAGEEGFTINVEVFSEYVMPNTALDEGELDANSYQHAPFLEDFIDDRGLDLVSVAETVNFPMGLYAEGINDVSEVSEGGQVALPNDPTNGARALMLFEDAGLIEVDEEAGASATLQDITDNPLNLEFIELEASQIPRQLGELDVAAINTNFAIEHGFSPAEDSVFMEAEDSPWVNLLVVRAENENDPAIEQLIDFYHSDEVRNFIEENFEGSVVAAW